MPILKQSNSYPLRMPDDLRASLEECAKASGRKLNAEIVARLQQSLESPTPDLAWADLAKLLQSEAEKQGAKITITIG
jgi:hypothetical protein